MRRRARVVLSDLDDTLFDHTHASRSALARVRADVSVFARWPLDDLERSHSRVLEAMHLEVMAGRVSVDRARIERFTRLLREVGADGIDDLAVDVAGRYRRAYEASWQPVAGALSLAAAVQRAGVPFVIVTNNIVSEQRMKLDRSGLAPFVSALITSEEVGICKPEAGIFVEALARVQMDPGDAVMIGDSWDTDIVGAVGAGVRAVWLNRTGAVRSDPSVAEVQGLEPVEDVLRLLIADDCES